MMKRREAASVLKAVAKKFPSGRKMLAKTADDVNYTHMIKMINDPLIIPNSPTNQAHIEKIVTCLVEANLLLPDKAEEIKNALTSQLTPEEKEEIEKRKSIRNKIGKIRIDITVGFRKHKKTFGITIAVFVAVILGFGAYYVYNTPSWEEDFSPTQYNKWTVNTRNSARWQDDVDGHGAWLVETDPDSSFGKMETQEITVDLSKHRTLCVDVQSIDNDASYTIQILDKNTGNYRDVLKDIRAPGENCVDLSQKMTWDTSRKKQTFTINCWIQGEGKRALFNSITLRR